MFSFLMNRYQAEHTANTNTNLYITTDADICYRTIHDNTKLLVKNFNQMFNITNTK